jgi:hypothetical protein
MSSDFGAPQGTADSSAPRRSRSEAEIILGKVRAAYDSTRCAIDALNHGDSVRCDTHLSNAIHTLSFLADWLDDAIALAQQNITRSANAATPTNPQSAEERQNINIPNPSVKP